MVIKKQKSTPKKSVASKNVSLKNTIKDSKKKTTKVDSTPVVKKKLFISKKEKFSNTVFDEAESFKKPHLTSFPFRSSWIVFFSVILVLFKAVLLLKYGFVDVWWKIEIIKRYISWLWNDILYCLVVRLIAQITMRIWYKPLKTVCVFVMSIFLYMYWADIFALVNFHSRFVLSWLLFFSRENAWPYILYWLWATILRLLWIYVSVWIVYIFVKYTSKRFSLHLLRIWVAFIVWLLWLSFFIPQTSPYQQNILQLEFFWKARDRPLTDKSVNKSYEQYFKPFKWKNTKPNIIIVFAESFSSIDSLYAWWSRNLLSWFDTIARDGTFYTNFIANWCTSDSSHIALLQWIEPRETTASQQEYTRYKSYTLWLPAFLNNQWYSSTFVSTTALWFLHQKDFLNSLQFETIIDNESFPTWKKYVFRAAPDEALYNETEKLLLTKNSKPQFITLQTISSHKPYDTPYWDDEDNAFRYSDEQLLNFYRKLQSMNYFDNGILIVVWDHRKMQAMWYDEIERRWKAAYGKAVLAVVWKNIPKGKKVITPIQHRDIFSSLKRLTSAWSLSLHEFYNDIFWWYQWRDSAVRYCQFVDRQYVASRADWSSWIITPNQQNQYASYIRAYYEFQQWKEYDGNALATTWNNPVTYPWLIRIAHQGYTVKSPPNSLDSYKAAKEVWAEWIEMDISFTRDWFPIVMHWPDIGRTKCINARGKKLVSDFDLQEMKDNCQLYNGQVILTLQEMLEKTQWIFDWYFIDVKVNFPEQRSYVWPMIKVIQKLWLSDKIMFSSTDPDTNYQLWSTRDVIAWREVFSTGDLESVFNSNHAFVLLPSSLVNQVTVNSILDAHKIPISYTVNSGVLLNKMYGWWVRYFITDKPLDIVK